MTSFKFVKNIIYFISNQYVIGVCEVALVGVRCCVVLKDVFRRSSLDTFWTKKIPRCLGCQEFIAITYRCAYTKSVIKFV